MAQEDKSGYSWLTHFIRTPVGKLVLVYLMFHWDNIAGLLGFLFGFGYFGELQSIWYVAVGVLLTLWFSRRNGRCCIPVCAVRQRLHQSQACSMEAMMSGLSWHCQCCCQHMPVSLLCSPCRYCVGVVHPTADGATTAAVHQSATDLLAAVLPLVLSAAAVATVTNLAVTTMARAASANSLTAADHLAAAARLASTPGPWAIMIATATTIAAFGARFDFLPGLLQPAAAACCRDLSPCHVDYNCSQTGMQQPCSASLEKEGDTKVLVQASDYDDGGTEDNPGGIPLPQQAQAMMAPAIEEKQPEAMTSRMEVQPLPPVNSSGRARVMSHSDGDVSRLMSRLLHPYCTVQQNSVAAVQGLPHTNPQPRPPGTRDHAIDDYPCLDVSGHTAEPLRMSDSAEPASSHATTVAVTTSACAVDNLETGAAAYASVRRGEPISAVAVEWPSRESTRQEGSSDPQKEMPIDLTIMNVIDSVPPAFAGGLLDSSFAESQSTEPVAIGGVEDVAAKAETATAAFTMLSITSASESDITHATRPYEQHDDPSPSIEESGQEQDEVLDAKAVKVMSDCESGIAHTTQPHEQHDDPSPSIEESDQEQDEVLDAKGSTLTMPIEESASAGMLHMHELSTSSSTIAETDHDPKKAPLPQMPPDWGSGMSSNATHSVGDQRLPKEPTPSQAMSATHQPVKAGRQRERRVPTGGNSSVSAEEYHPDSAADSFSPKTERTTDALLPSAAGVLPANAAPGEGRPP